MFSGLSQGSPLYILNTKECKQYVCPIEYISAPRVMYPTYTPGVSNGMNMGSVLDIAVTIDGKRKEFTGVSSVNSVSTSTDFIITDSREAMISQVDSLLQDKQRTVDSIDTIKQEIVGLKEVLKGLNPSFAKETAMDNAISELKERVNTMQTEFGSIKGDVRQVLQILTNGKQ